MIKTELKFTNKALNIVLYSIDRLEEYRTFMIDLFDREFSKAKTDALVKQLESQSILARQLIITSTNLHNLEFKFNAYESIIIWLFSIIENGFDSLCNAQEKDKKLMFNYKHMKGSGINRARLYLDLVGEARFAKVQEQWKSIDTLRKIKNCVIHHLSYPPEEVLKDEEVAKLVMKGYIEVNGPPESKRFYITPEYTGYIIGQAKDFFQGIGF